MKYISTRGDSLKLSAAEAVVKGLAPDGGLFVPEKLPVLSGSLLAGSMPYYKLASEVMGLFFEGYSGLEEALKNAYGRFRHPDTAPVTVYGEDCYLELWHGPTCAFKDMALQVLPFFMKKSCEMTGDNRHICILTATSGDTGKAALEAFRDVPGMSVVCFFPGGVSAVQKLQMITQEGNNVLSCEVMGNFDDAQSGVKALFMDESLRRENIAFSSANSINLGRLVPQIAYYVSAYSQMVQMGRIKNGEKLNFCVPTGNFGNILAGYLAEMMGLPVGKLICASNKNDVLTEFFRTGVYDRRRELAVTFSPSMDILISSNLERALFYMSGMDHELISSLMGSLAAEGRYVLPEKLRKNLPFACGSCNDEETVDTISRVYKETGALIDPHTAVASFVLDKYKRETGDNTPAVTVSTASPFKFCGAVLRGVLGESLRDGAYLIDKLSGFTAVKCPPPLLDLDKKPVRHKVKCTPADMGRVVEDFIAPYGKL